MREYLKRLAFASPLIPTDNAGNRLDGNNAVMAIWMYPGPMSPVASYGSEVRTEVRTKVGAKVGSKVGSRNHFLNGISALSFRFCFHFSFHFLIAYGSISSKAQSHLCFETGLYGIVEYRLKAPGLSFDGTAR